MRNLQLYTPYYRATLPPYHVHTASITTPLLIYVLSDHNELTLYYKINENILISGLERRLYPSLSWGNAQALWNLGYMDLHIKDDVSTSKHLRKSYTNCIS